MHGLRKFIFFRIGKIFISGCFIIAVFIYKYFDLGRIKVILNPVFYCENVTKAIFNVMKYANRSAF